MMDLRPNFTIGFNRAWGTAFLSFLLLSSFSANASFNEVKRFFPIVRGKNDNLEISSKIDLRIPHARVLMCNLTDGVEFYEQAQRSDDNVETQNAYLHRIANFWDSEIERKGASPTEQQKAWEQSTFHWEDYLQWRDHQDFTTDLVPEQKAQIQERTSVNYHTGWAVNRIGMACEKKDGPRGVCVRYLMIPADYFTKNALDLYMKSLQNVAPLKELRNGDEAIDWWRHLIDARRAYQKMLPLKAAELFERFSLILESKINLLSI